AYGKPPRPPPCSSLSLSLWLEVRSPGGDRAPWRCHQVRRSRYTTGALHAPTGPHTRAHRVPTGIPVRPPRNCGSSSPGGGPAWRARDAAFNRQFEPQQVLVLGLAPLSFAACAPVLERVN